MNLKTYPPTETLPAIKEGLIGTLRDCLITDAGIRFDSNGDTRSRRSAINFLKYANSLPIELFVIFVSTRSTMSYTFEPLSGGFFGDYDHVFMVKCKATEWAIEKHVRECIFENLPVTSDEIFIRVVAQGHKSFFRDEDISSGILNLNYRSCLCKKLDRLPLGAGNKLAIVRSINRNIPKELGKGSLCRHRVRRFWLENKTAQIYARVMYG